MSRLLASIAVLITIAGLSLHPQQTTERTVTSLERAQAVEDDARLPEPAYPNVVALWEAEKPADALKALDERTGATDGQSPLDAQLLRAKLLSAVGRHEESAQLWDQIRTSEDSLEKVAVRAEADSLIQAGNLARAEQLLADRPAADFGAQLLMLGTAYRYRIGADGDRAATLLRRVIAAPPSAAVSDQARMELALAMQQSGNAPGALALLRDLELRFRQPDTFRRARTQRQILERILSRDAGRFSVREYQSLADRLRNFSAYEPALEVLQEWKQSYPPAASRADALIVDTLYRARSDQEADAKAAAYLRAYPESPQAADIRVLQFRLAVREGRTAEVKSRGRDLLRGRVAGVSLDDRLALGRLLAAYLVSVGEASDGLETYREVFRDSRSRDMRLDVLWRSGVAAIRAGHLERAEDTFNTLRAMRPGPDTTAIADYWTGVIYQRRNRTEVARELFIDLANRRPYDYYGMRARERLTGLKVPGPEPRGRLIFPSRVLQSPTSSRPEMRAAQLLARAGLKSEAAEIARSLAADLRGDPALALLAARASENAGDHARSVRLIETRFAPFLEQPAEQVPADFWMLAYPRAFWEAIQTAASRVHVDPLLLLALARQESRFDPSVRSVVGAIGLFQLMPYTADQLAPRIGIAVDDRRTLFEPTTSAAYAAQLVADLLHQFNEDPVAVMAAYNAGEERVRDWWNSARGFGEDLFVDTIPYTETRTYVRSVYTNLKMYQRLYN